MRISVVTPCYNAGRWLAETIASIQSQVGVDIEHIVVDGGSSDDTLDIVRTHPRIRLLTGRDRGMYDALNKGFAIATGDVFAYLNADDLWYPDSAMRAVNALAADPAVVGVYSDVDYMDEESRSLGRYRVPAALDFAALSCRDFSMIPQPTAFWRRSAHLATGGFNADYRIAGDFDFFLALAKQGKLQHLGAPLARFRLLANSLTARGADRTPEEVAKILRDHGVACGWTRACRGHLMRLRMAMCNVSGWSRRRTALTNIE